MKVNVTTGNRVVVRQRENKKVNVKTETGMVSVPAFTGQYEITPHADRETVLECSGKKMTDNVTVFKVPYFETSNPDGQTVYIASEA